MTKRAIKNIKLNKCIKCGSNEWHLIFPKHYVRGKCAKCNYQRELTHTEINVYCWMWA